MIDRKTYMLLRGISTRTLYRWITEGRVVAVGDEYIIDEHLPDIPQKIKSQIIRAKRSEFDTWIESARADRESHKLLGLKWSEKSIIAKIHAELLRLSKLGIRICGYSDKSINRKLNYGTKRQVREDCGKIRNETLKSSHDKFIDLAKNYYLHGAERNIRRTIDLVVEHAKNDEEYYELASIPKATLIRHFTAEVQAGIGEIHDYLNSHNVWHNQRAKVTGAFTDHRDIKFGDYIAGDDNKQDVHKVLVYNPVNNKVEEKTLYTWFWTELVTQKVLAYIVKTSAITTEDIIVTLIMALKYFGKPGKGLLIDNGKILRSDDFKQFTEKMKIKRQYGRPYTGTDKSPQERLFGYIKTERNSFWNNFTGSNHKTEGRHTGLSLTPDKPNYTFEDFLTELDNYINGFYENRPRNRVIKGKKETISVKDYFDRMYMKYEPSLVDDRDIRNAYMRDDDKQYIFRNELNFRSDKYIPLEPLPIAFNGRKFKVACNPSNLNEIDLIASERIVDRMTGTYLDPGDYAATLYRTRVIPNSREIVSKLNKKHRKAVRELAELYLDRVVADNRELWDKVNSSVNRDGKIKHTRDEIVKQISKTIESTVPEKKLRDIIDSNDETRVVNLNDLLNKDEIFNAERISIDQAMKDFDDLNDEGI